MDSSEKKVAVAVRIRPRLPIGVGSSVQQEEYQHPNCVIVQDECTLRLQEQKQDENCRSSTFTFDFVFDTDSQQSEVYEEAVQELVDASLAGANCTVLAYGQTGSGKTHTVLGQVKSNPLDGDLLMPESGLFLRTLKDLFEYKKRREDKAWVVICLSCIEIYLDFARDLLGTNPGENIKIQMTDEDVKMPTLTRYEILNLNDVYKHFKEASKHRTTRATEANSASSRSHCLFVIDIIQQERTDKNPAQPDISFLKDLSGAMKQGRAPGGRGDAKSPTTGSSPKGASPNHMDPSMANIIYRKDEPPILVSKIVLADLAGSEKSSGKTGSGAQAGTAMFKEMLKINMSLTALGNVAHALHKGASHVPYRDSTLTRILRPSFAAPLSKVLLISNLSPTQLSYDESFSTLQFANKVKAMKVNNSMVGAEQQQLQFDYLETQKTQWALLADLHIANLHYENDPMLRRYTDMVETTYYTHRLRLKNQEKERQKIIKELEPAGREEKARIAKKIEARKAREAEERKEMHREIYEGLVDEFNNKVAAIQQQIDVLTQEANDFQSKLDQQISERTTETKDHEEVVARLSKEKKEFRGRVENAMVQLEALNKEKTRLNEEEKKHKIDSTNKKSGEESDLAQHEVKYVSAMWRHCKAQEYFFIYKAYRETHLALVDAQRQNLLRIEQALNESDKLSKMAKN
eukprot:TRINITY_DN11904_c0_g2_i1.p1 TRINITY_DN11904_c0_g2~~TRINITY_DN11904_c0_g2_i1.p1  ORF type:complete len:690 (+),score=260.59 TRINITY_DN11904_c0_g2_i1:86-2155(+)